jgi:predicted exporter
LGAGLSLSVLVFIFGSISAIALGIGAVLIGISIDYSLHLFTHYRESGSITKTLADIALPLLMSGLTTAAAFLCLFIVKADALNQLGMFAAFSVFFSSLMVLLILPYLIAGSAPEKKHLLYKKTLFDKISAYEIHKSKAVLCK